MKAMKGVQEVEGVEEYEHAQRPAILASTSSTASTLRKKTEAPTIPSGCRSASVSVEDARRSDRVPRDARRLFRCDCADGSAVLRIQRHAQHWRKLRFSWSLASACRTSCGRPVAPGHDLMSLLE